MIPSSFRIVLILIIITHLSSKAQIVQHWSRAFQGDTVSDITHLISTPDNGILIGGNTWIFANKDIKYLQYPDANQDVWIIKTDENGAKKWEMTYGGKTDGYITGNEYMSGLILTKDNHIVMSIASESAISGNKTVSPDCPDRDPNIFTDIWLIKTDFYGKEIWQKCIGGPLLLLNPKIVETEDNGFLVLATRSESSISTEGGCSVTSSSKGDYDFIVFKIDSEGNKIWDKTYGGSLDDEAKKIIKTNDGGYLIGGISNSGISGDKSQACWGGNDNWLLKIDSDGNKIWDKRFGSPIFENFADVIQTSDNGFLMSGVTGLGSSGGDIQALPISSYGLNIWVVKIDSSGNFQWDGRYENQNGSNAGQVVELPNKEFMITGSDYGPQTYKIIITDSVGNTKHIKHLGENRFFKCLAQMSPNQFILGLTKGYLNETRANYYIDKICLDNQCGFISGNVYDDLNQNCIKDTNESGLSNMLIEITPGPIVVNSDQNGKFNVGLSDGKYIIKPYNLDLIKYKNICIPDSGYHVTLTNNYVDSLSLPITRLPYNDLKISVATGRFRPGFDCQVVVDYTNLGHGKADGKISVKIDSRMTSINATPAYQRASENVLEWDLKDLKENEVNKIVMNCYLPPNVSFLGETFITTAKIENEMDDKFPGNNTDTVNTLVTGSFDPNDKSVIPAGRDDEHYINSDDSLLTYLIRFQNTGSDTAFRVVVKDTLSPLLDLQSLDLGAASHPYTFSVSGMGVLSWTFDNIMLPPKSVNEPLSEGFIKYSIKQKNNSPGSVIQNKADIYFDFNPEITTNTVFNTISYEASAISKIEEREGLLIYPNPFSDQFLVRKSSGNNVSSIVVRDLFGKKYIERNVLSDDDIIINSQKLERGIYIIEIVSQLGLSVFKVVKY